MSVQSLLLAVGVLVIVGFVYYFSRKAFKGEIYMSSNIKRVSIFFLAVITEVVITIVQGYGFDRTSIIWLSVAGIEALLILETMHLSRSWLRWFTLPIYLPVFLFIKAFLENIVGGVLYKYSPLQYIVDIKTYISPYNYPSVIISSFVITLTAYFLAKDSRSSIKQGAASEKLMLDISDDLVTRLLCISAITQGRTFRKMVLERVENQYKANAPEFGMDLDLIAGVCKFMEQRETKFQLYLFGAGIVGGLLSLSPLGWLPMVVFTAPIVFYKKYNEQFDLLKKFTNSDYDSEKVKNYFGVRSESQDPQNLVVYGGFSPFVGAGVPLNGWSFAIDVKRPGNNGVGKNKTAIDFDVAELYKELETACAGLNLPNIRISDLAFVSGLDIRNDKAILPDQLGKPAQQIDNSYLKSADDFRVRQYKHISVSAWGNEVIFSIFIRFVTKGNNLFVETARYLLPPVDNQYRQFNRISSGGFSKGVGMGIQSLILGPINGYFVWLLLFGKFFEFLSKSLGLRDRNLRNFIKTNPDYNYGATSSLRQDVSGNYSRYFQVLDKEMFVKILDNQILETIISFLDEHNIDTSQLRERQTIILNNGVIGDVTAQNIAVGQGAQAVTAGQPKAK